MRSLVKFFWMPTLVGLVSMGLVAAIGGMGAFIITALLVVLEVSLSFDNAVVNARVLARMSEVWQRRFLTWGIFFAVFITRAVLPIFIVAASVAASPLAIFELAIFDPAQYGELLDGAHYVINAFGAVFLIMVGLKYFFDEAKKEHWFALVESRLARWGRIEAVEIALTLVLLLFAALLLPGHAAEVLIAGIIGLITFILVQGIASAFEVEKAAVGAGLALFLYLNVLDAAFSLDSVVGAFALSTNLIVIVVGLGVGALFVRSLTVWMVRENTLQAFKYLEHGAHYAILGLAGAMLAGLVLDVPEPITGLIGLVFIGAAFVSSWRGR